MGLDDDDSADDVNEAALSIAQLIRFNSLKRRRCGTKYRRHPREQETPLPLYNGIMLFNRTRKKGLINRMAKLGLSVSYDRVQNIQTSIAQNICDKFQRRNCVVPLALEQGQFTLSAIDNLDQNAKSTTAQTHFHGTAISMFQFGSTSPAVKRRCVDVNQNERDKKISFPAYYAEVEPVKDGKIQKPLPMIAAPTHVSQYKSIDGEIDWLKKVDQVLTAQEPAPEQISWAAYYSGEQDSPPHPPCKNTMLPLLKDSINSKAVVCHLMKIIAKTLTTVNPEQSPTITADQPVYALAKQIQWQFPSRLGEDKMVVMMGDLHTEMATMAMIGDWLEGSEWAEIFVAAGISTPGTSDAYLIGHNVKRCRYAHQEYQRSFKQYCECLEQLTPWMFSMDHTHYAKWLPVFIQTLNELEVLHPEIYTEFMDGKFVVQKSKKKFSCIGVDHAHEQNNKVVKGDGGVIRILDQPNALMKWMMAGPEMSLMVDECESLLRNKDKDDSSKRHEDTLAFEKKFKKDVKAFADILEGEGNPFEEEEDILITLMSKKVMDEESARSVKIARDAGATQYREFKVERLITGKTSVHEPIKRNKFSLFRNKNSIKTSSSKLKLTTMKQDCQLFSRLYVVCQSRESDLSEFFAHENHVYPPALSMYGKLRQTAKSNCLKIFDEYIIVQTERPSDITAVLLDGAAIVHMVSPLSSRNFQDYADNEMASFFKTILANRDLRRLDLVFDVYRESSIKELERSGEQGPVLR
eukprot:gene4062-4614_t